MSKDLKSLTPKIPKADQSFEIKALSKNLEETTTLKNNILNDLRKEREKNSELTKENVSLKLAIEETYKKVRTLEQAMNGERDSDGKSGDYLDIVTVPPVKGFDLPPKTIRGTMVPRRVDENGFIYETIPRENAVQILSSLQGPKVYLLGPVDKVTGYKKKGLYNESFEILRHKLVKDVTGYCQFVPVIVEESK